MVKRYVWKVVAMATFGFAAISCATAPPAEEDRSVSAAPEGQPVEEVSVEITETLVRQPELLDHKNFKFGREVPDWVALEASEIEARELYPSSYAFKFESPRAQDLQGAQIWTRNFIATSELAQIVRDRVEVKFAGAVAGDIDLVESYLEQVVQRVSETEFSGYRPVSDYWLQLRYYSADGSVEEDAYTYIVLYTIPKAILDGLIQQSLEGADAEQPASEEERSARALVREAFEEGL